jgi:hypothetical protein
MRPTHDTLLGEALRGVVCLAVARWWALRGQGRGLGGSAGHVCSPLPHRGDGQGLWQAGGRGGAAAQTP